MSLADPAGRSSPETTTQRGEREVMALMSGLEAWFNGDVPEDAGVFGEFERALADDFVILFPSGREAGRTEVIGQLRAAYGKRRTERLRVTVSDFTLRAEGAELCVVGYVETKATAKASERFAVTAVLRSVVDRRNGLEWVLVHETEMS